MFYQLDPTGDPTQSPKVLSQGWNNPFAYDISGLDHLWVADNSPGTQPERIGRGDIGNIIGTLSIKTAPAGLAVLSETNEVTTMWSILALASQPVFQELSAESRERAVAWLRFLNGESAHEPAIENGDRRALREAARLIQIFLNAHLHNFRGLRSLDVLKRLEAMGGKDA